MVLVLQEQSVAVTVLLRNINMIVKSGKGYSVKSEKGKNLGGPYKSKAAAAKRLRQVEYFKHKVK